MPKPYSGGAYGRISAKSIEESLPDAVGAFIAWITDPAHGWQVSERQADGSGDPLPLDGGERVPDGAPGRAAPPEQRNDGHGAHEDDDRAHPAASQHRLHAAARS